jgi:hypothetical protein
MEGVTMKTKIRMVGWPKRECEMIPGGRDDSQGHCAAHQLPFHNRGYRRKARLLYHWLPEKGHPSEAGIC